MTTNLITISTVAALTLILPGTASAYSHASRYGGSTSHSYGSTSRGSAAAKAVPQAYGGAAAAHAAGVPHTTPYGTTAYMTTYRTSGVYYGYYPPTLVGTYQAQCYHCGYASGARAAGPAPGMVGVGTSSASGPDNSGDSAAKASIIAVSNDAASADTTAEADEVDVSSLFATPEVTYVSGVAYAVLPAGCITPLVEGAAYFLCANTWFSPAYGANGLYYRVITPP
jgi:hypothetical protein